MPIVHAKTIVQGGKEKKRTIIRDFAGWLVFPFFAALTAMPCQEALVGMDH